MPVENSMFFFHMSSSIEVRKEEWERSQMFVATLLSTLGFFSRRAIAWSLLAASLIHVTASFIAVQKRLTASGFFFA